MFLERLAVFAVWEFLFRTSHNCKWREGCDYGQTTQINCRVRLCFGYFIQILHCWVSGSFDSILLQLPIHFSEQISLLFATFRLIFERRHRQLKENLGNISQFTFINSQERVKVSTCRFYLIFVWEILYASVSLANTKTFSCLC